MSENLFYPGYGRPCPDCKCFFNSLWDLNLHRQRKPCPPLPVWKPSKFNDVDRWIWSTEDAKLKTALLQNGGVLIVGDCKFTLNGDGSIVKRRHI